jgi:hypothetical protein
MGRGERAWRENLTLPTDGTANAAADEAGDDVAKLLKMGRHINHQVLHLPRLGRLRIGGDPETLSLGVLCQI